MTERPIIFNAEMVRAILDGRKAQTRRIMKADCMDVGEMDDGTPWPWRENSETFEDYWYPCPFGVVGDRLWVRETWMPDAPRDGTWADVEFYGCKRSPLSMIPEHYRTPEHCIHRASWTGSEMVGWTPSIHMPRWASRITLEITGVRLERLNSISEEDAMNEGIDADRLAESQDNYDCIADHNMTGRPTAIGHFSDLWQTIYGADSWQANPWVWVVEFRRVEGEQP